MRDNLAVKAGNTGTLTASKKSKAHDRSISISKYLCQGGANNLRLNTFESLKLSDAGCQIEPYAYYAYIPAVIFFFARLLTL